MATKDDMIELVNEILLAIIKSNILELESESESYLPECKWHGLRYCDMCNMSYSDFIRRPHLTSSSPCFQTPPVPKEFLEAMQAKEAFEAVKNKVDWPFETEDKSDGGIVSTWDSI